MDDRGPTATGIWTGEEKEKKLKEVKAIIRGLVVSSSQQMNVHNLLKDYFNNEGQSIPFRQFGFRNVIEFLESIPDTIVLTKAMDYGGSITRFVKPVVTAEIEHINRMVLNQRQKPNTRRRDAGVRRPRSTSSPPPISESCYTTSGQKENIRKQQTTSRELDTSPRSSSARPVAAKCEMPPDKKGQVGDTQKTEIKQTSGTHLTSANNANLHSTNQPFSPGYYSGSNLVLPNNIPNTANNNVHYPPPQQLQQLLHLSQNALLFNQQRSGYPFNLYQVLTGSLPYQHPSVFAQQQVMFNQNAQPQYPKPYSVQQTGTTTQSCVHSSSGNKHIKSPMNYEATPINNSEQNIDKRSKDLMKETLPQSKPQEDKRALKTSGTTERHVDNESQLLNKLETTHIDENNDKILSSASSTRSSKCSSITRSKRYMNKLKNKKLPDNLIVNLIMLLEENISGIFATELSSRYKARFDEELCFYHYGYANVIDMANDLSELIYIHRNDNGAVFYFQETPEVVKLKEREQNENRYQRIPSNIRRNLELVIQKNHNGIPADLLCDVYKASSGDTLNLSSLGCQDIMDLVFILQSNILRLSFERSRAIVYPLSQVKTCDVSEQDHTEDPPADFTDLIVPLDTELPVLKWPKLAQIGTFVPIHPSEIYTPSQFYFQFKGRNYSERLNELMGNLNIFYTKYSKYLTLKTPQIGLLVVCQFENVFHRAKILEMKNNLCRMFYVDYGTEEYKLSSELYYMCKDFIYLPPQACTGVLYDLKPVGHYWTQKAVETFVSLIPKEKAEYGYLAQIMMMYREYNMMIMILHDGDKSDAKIINDELIRLGMASYISLFKTVPNDPRMSDGLVEKFTPPSKQANSRMVRPQSTEVAQRNLTAVPQQKMTTKSADRSQLVNYTIPESTKKYVLPARRLMQTADTVNTTQQQPTNAQAERNVSMEPLSCRKYATSGQAQTTVNVSSTQQQPTVARAQPTLSGESLSTVPSSIIDTTPEDVKKRKEEQLAKYKRFLDVRDSKPTLSQSNAAQFNSDEEEMEARISIPKSDSVSTELNRCYILLTTYKKYSLHIINHESKLFFLLDEIARDVMQKDVGHILKVIRVKLGSEFIVVVKRTQHPALFQQMEKLKLRNYDSEVILFPVQSVTSFLSFYHEEHLVEARYDMRMLVGNVHQKYHIRSPEWFL